MLIRFFRLLLIVGGFLTAQFALAQTQIYTLEFLHTADRSLAQEQALIISGVVKVPCRVTTSAGTFYLRCGKSTSIVPLQVEVERLKSLGIDKVTLVQIDDDSNEVLHDYQPIDVGSESQENLLKMARKRLSFAYQTEPDAKKEPDMLAEAKRLRELDRGNTLVGQGWLAYQNNDFKTAIDVFTMASEMDTVRLPALFGLSLAYFNDGQFQASMAPFRILLEQDYEKDTVLALYLQAALKTGNHDIVKNYYRQLPVEQHKQWQENLEKVDLQTAYSKLKYKPRMDQLARFIADNQKFLERCEPVDIWDNLGKRLVAFKAKSTALNLYRHMWKSCHDEGIRVGILYQLNKVDTLDAQMARLSEELKTDMSQSYRRQLNDFYYNTMMAEADRLPPGSEEAGEIYKNIKRPYNAYTRFKLAKAWWSYQRDDFTTAMADFSWLWHNRDNREGLKGMLFAMMKLGKIDSALEIVKRQKVPEMEMMLYKEKLASINTPSKASFDLAHHILQKEPNYTPALSALGWKAIADKEYSLATTYFKRWQALEPGSKQPLSGLMQSYAKQQKFDDAFSLAQQLDKPGEYNWQYNVQFDQALQLFNDKHYDKAERIFKDLMALKPDERSLQTLLSWSLFHQGKYKKSAKGFLALYQKKEDSDVAQGYLSSLDKLDKGKKKQKFIDELAQSDNSENRGLAAQEYRNQKDFLRAAFVDQSQDKYYTGVDNTEVWLDYNYHHKTGTYGISALDIKDVQLGASFVWDPSSRLYLTVNVQQLDANLRSAQPFLGNDFTYGEIPPEFPGADLSAVSTKDTVWYPFVRYRREDQWDLDMGVGLSPLSGPLTSKLVWFFSAERASNSFSVYRRPLIESQLNYIGLKDPYSTKKWGRVLQTGVEYRNTGTFSDDYWYSAKGSYNRYAGSNLLTNQSGDLSAAFGTDFDADNMNISAGVSLGGMGYQRNSIFYSYGHGGYFSPQTLWQAGVFGHFESKVDEVDWWELDIGVGYFSWRTKPQERYPFGLFKQTDPGSEASGISYSVRGEKHWRFGKHFEVGIAGELGRSPGYEKWRAGIIFRYFWKEHNYLMDKHRVIRPWAR